MPNKVEFGLKNVHVGPYTVDPETGTATLGQGEAIPGAVSLVTTVDANNNVFHADDVGYYSFFSESGESGELQMALFPDSFKKKYLGYVALADGGVARVKGSKAVPFWIAFEGDGDANKRRHLLLNVTAGQINREHRTKTDSTEVEVETLPISVTGDNKTGFTKVSYNADDSGYTTVLTAPTISTVAV